MTYIRTEHRGDGVLLVWFDRKDHAQNTLSMAMFGELEEAIAKVDSSGTTMVILVSSKKDFIAGADVEAILEMDAPGQAGQLSRDGQAMLRRLEDAAVPVIAAIHGACLGGGLETALACHGRVASNDSRTQLGLPEVQLGLLPGGGGTQRLPRLIGLAPALDLMLTGRRLRARQALRLGLVDCVVPHAMLIDEAIALGHKIATSGWRRSNPQSVTMRVGEATGPGRALILNQAKKQVRRQTRGNYPAPERILECIRVGYRDGIEAGFAAESQGFDELAQTDGCKNLVRLFLGMTAARKNPMAEEAHHLERIGVLGAGLMGAGIANVSIRAGVGVILKDLDWQRVGAGMKHAGDAIARRVKRRECTKAEGDQIMARLTGTTDGVGFDQADLVIEAVFEDLDIKHRVLADFEARSGADVVFASNTSALPIKEIAKHANHPERVLGMHYFSPVEKMPLLEIIVTEQTAPWALATALEAGCRQGKSCIVVKDGPGFYTTRILAPYMNEAAHLLEAGVNPAALDGALKDFGFPVGPVALLDEVGIDVAAHVSTDLGAVFRERYGSTESTLARRLAEKGYLGRKSGAGIFLYTRRRGAKLPWPRGRQRPQNPGFTAVLESTPDQPLPSDAVDRLVLAMVNEAIRCLEEGVIRGPSDGDLGAILGLGFPPFLGGPFRYVDQVGASNIVEKLDQLAVNYGAHFSPSALLTKKAKSNERFHQ